MSKSQIRRADEDFLSAYPLPRQIEILRGQLAALVPPQRRTEDFAGMLAALAAIEERFPAAAAQRSRRNRGSAR